MQPRSDGNFNINATLYFMSGMWSGVVETTKADTLTMGEDALNKSFRPPFLNPINVKLELSTQCLYSVYFLMLINWLFHHRKMAFSFRKLLASIVRSNFSCLCRKCSIVHASKASCSPIRQPSKTAGVARLLFFLARRRSLTGLCCDALLSFKMPDWKLVTCEAKIIKKNIFFVLKCDEDYC